MPLLYAEKRWCAGPPTFCRVSQARLSKSTLATRSGRVSRPMYSFAAVMGNRDGSFCCIEPELSMARMTSLFTCVIRLSWIVGRGHFVMIPGAWRPWYYGGVHSIGVVTTVE